MLYIVGQDLKNRKGTKMIFMSGINNTQCQHISPSKTGLIMSSLNEILKEYCLFISYKVL